MVGLCPIADIWIQISQSSVYRLFGSTHPLLPPCSQISVSVPHPLRDSCMIIFKGLFCPPDSTRGLPNRVSWDPQHSATIRSHHSPSPPFSSPFPQMSGPTHYRWVLVAWWAGAHNDPTFKTTHTHLTTTAEFFAPALSENAQNNIDTDFRSALFFW